MSCVCHTVLVRAHARRSRRPHEKEAGFDNGDPIVWMMLVLNLLCLVIALCFMVITRKTRKSADGSEECDDLEREQVREERLLQKKVGVIAVTDFFCWLPFVIISALHNLEHIDATSWYTGFVMIVLPLNSVINPVVADKAFGEFFKNLPVKLVSTVRLGVSSVSARQLR